MEASIIISTKNQLQYLKKTLPTLKKQDFRGGYEIIVVDSGSTDGAREYLAKSGVILLKIRPEEFNYSKVLNLGGRKAKGKILVILSGDAIPLGKDWLAEMTRPFSDPKVGGVYGKYVITGRRGWGYPNFWPSLRFPQELTRYSVSPTPFLGVYFLGFPFGNPATALKTFNFAGACCAVRRSIWGKRPFNEELLGGEDAEYAWFLHLIGYDIVYNPNVAVLHEHKKEKIGNSIRYALGLSDWQFVFNWQIIKYWLRRLFFGDPYKSLRAC